MPQSLPMGIVLVLLAGLMAGNCMLPIKFNRMWKWENTWFVFSLVSLVVLPWALALSLVDHLFQAYSSLTFSQVAVPVLFGAGWGVAQVLFGISIQRLGLGPAYAIVIGLGTLLGTLVPLFAQQRGQVSRNLLINILAGIAVMLIGITLSAWAGHKREHSSDGTAAIRVSGQYFAAVCSRSYAASSHPCSTSRSLSDRILHTRRFASAIPKFAPLMPCGPSAWLVGWYRTLDTACICFEKTGQARCFSHSTRISSGPCLWPSCGWERLRSMA